MYQVVKRDGTQAQFNVNKISAAIQKAFEACNREYHPTVIDMIALRVTSDFESKIQDGLIGVEDIQDSVEKVLSESGYSDVSKAYILYRKQRENIRNIQATAFDYKKIVDNYLDAVDLRENKATSYSIGGLILSNSAMITANYWLTEIYDEEISDAHRNGEFHIHDLSMLSGCNAGWSLRKLIENGLGGVSGKLSSKPAKHLSTLCTQMINFLGIMQNEWSGAQGFSSFDTYLAPFVRVDELSYKDVKQCLQTFIYGVNTPSRWGTQAPFSNISLDWNVPKDLKDEKAIVGGVPQDFTYGDCQKEMDFVNRAFLEILLEGDDEGRGFAYPIPTYAITKEIDWSTSENIDLLFQLSIKYGTPHFANYVNSHRDETDVHIHDMNIEELQYKAGGYFGSGENTGEIGLVTINLPRIAYESKDKDDFYLRLDHMMDLSARSLKIKRDVLTKLLDAGLYPYTKQYLGTFEHHFSTIGVIGMNEVGLNAKWLKEDLTHLDTQMFAYEVLQHMQQRCLVYQKKYGDFYNLEASLALEASYRLAKIDLEKYPDIKTSMNEDEPCYTNSSFLPEGYDGDIFTALEIEDPLQSSYTSGTIFHIPIDHREISVNTAKLLVEKVVKHYKLPYFTLNPTYSVCIKDGYLKGETKICPECQSETEVFTRRIGEYYRK